jgi:predicted DNA-binding ribbon-helix-helix protein
MCRLFVTQDPASYAPETRSVRLHGHVTSIRLEAAFWEVLEEIAAAERTTVARFVATLNDEVMEEGSAPGNLASFLRVSCLCWMRARDEHAEQARLGQRRALAEALR